VEVMGGEGSDSFNLFTMLFIAGFMEARKHAHKFVMLAEVMYTDSKMACFLGTSPSHTHTLILIILGLELHGVDLY
jgi:hypothetical protein